MRDRFAGAEVELIASRGGRFEVVLDSVPIYQKSVSGRHAKPGEVVELIEATR